MKSKKSSKKAKKCGCFDDLEHDAIMEIGIKESCRQFFNKYRDVILGDGPNKNAITQAVANLRYIEEHGEFLHEEATTHAAELAANLRYIEEHGEVLDEDTIKKAADLAANLRYIEEHGDAAAD